MLVIVPPPEEIHTRMPALKPVPFTTIFVPVTVVPLMVQLSVSGLFATIATGGKVTASDVKAALQTAQDKTKATQ